MFHGAFVPEALVRNRDISRGAAQLYGQLARYAGRDGACFPRQERLAGDFGVAVRTIQRWLQELVGAGFVTTRRRGQAGRRSNSYGFSWHPSFDHGQQLLDFSGTAGQADRTEPADSVQRPVEKPCVLDGRPAENVASGPARSLSEESHSDRNSSGRAAHPEENGPKTGCSTGGLETAGTGSSSPLHPNTSARKTTIAAAQAPATQRNKPAAGETGRKPPGRALWSDRELRHGPRNRTPGLQPLSEIARRLPAAMLELLETG